MTADTLHSNDIIPQSDTDSTTNNVHNRRLTKNEKRRLKKKGHNHEHDQDHESSSESKQQDENQNSSNHLHEANGSTNHKSALLSSSSSHTTKKPTPKKELEEIEVEYVSATDYLENDPLFKELQAVFAKFTKPEELLSAQLIDKHNIDDLFPTRNKSSQLTTNTDNTTTGDSSMDLTEGQKKLLSKKKKKLLSRLSVAELKQLVTRPDVVEAHDISSTDPRLLVFLKGCRNSVPVPRHWCHIRKYLQGKRGIEKIPFQLPEFIAETGIAKIRETVMEQEALKNSKRKQRERIRPKMGKIDIDYQVLHDAFFKYQTKPKMTIHGDLYYEGKEFEVQLKEKQPGIFSAELVTALGMTEGAPPPWLINMQRYGPPPSYPTLRIPGLNAPLPPGAIYGYQPGGWGKPPVDEYGRPLYGDVFGLTGNGGGQENTAVTTTTNGVEIDKTFRWGGYEVTEEEEEVEDDDEEDEEAADEGAGEGVGEEDTTSKRSRRTTEEGFRSGLTTPSLVDGTSSLVSGLETPAAIDLRKRTGLETPDISISAAAAGASNAYMIQQNNVHHMTNMQKELFYVLQEKKTTGGGAAGVGAGAGMNGQMFGSDRVYSLPGKHDVQLSINPEEIEDIMNNKEKVKQLHETHIANKPEQLYVNRNSQISTDGIETEEDKLKGSRKRKAEQPVIQRKVKDFKF